MSDRLQEIKARQREPDPIPQTRGVWGRPDPRSMGELQAWIVQLREDIRFLVTEVERLRSEPRASASAMPQVEYYERLLRQRGVGTPQEDARDDILHRVASHLQALEDALLKTRQPEDNQPIWKEPAPRGRRTRRTTP
jgi:hypothetical protein